MVLRIGVETLYNRFFKQFVDLWRYISPLLKTSNKPHQISHFWTLMNYEQSNYRTILIKYDTV